MKRTFATIALLAVCAAFAFAQQVRLDNAIRSAAEDLSASIGRGNRVAVIAMESDSNGLSGYLVSEMIHAFVRLQARHGFTVVDRAHIDMLLVQLEFDMSGFVDENTAQRIGRFMGAQFVVAGEFEPLGNTFRFRVRVFEVETAAIRGSYAATVQRDNIINNFLNPPTVIQPPMRGGFTNGERWGAFFLNLVIPSAGSFAIMEDWVGGTIQVLMFAIEFPFFIFGTVDGVTATSLIPWGVCFGFRTAMNIVSSAMTTRSTRRASVADPEAWNIALTPGRNGIEKISLSHAIRF